MVAKKRKAPQSQQTTLRHVWLAGLGLAAVARREALALPGRIVHGATRLQQLAIGRVTRKASTQRKSTRRRGAQSR